MNHFNHTINETSVLVTLAWSRLTGRPEPHVTRQFRGWQMFGGGYLQAGASLICFALSFWSNWGGLGLDPLLQTTKKKRTSQRCSRLTDGYEYVSRAAGKRNNEMSCKNKAHGAYRKSTRQYLKSFGNDILLKPKIENPAFEGIL